MRIWLITSSYPREPSESINAGVLARDVALDLASQGHQVTVVTPGKPGGVRFDDELDGVTIPWLKPSLEISDLSKNPFDLIRTASLLLAARVTVSRETRSRPPDAVIALWGLPSGIFARRAAARVGCPYAVWLLGSDVWRATELPRGQSTLTQVLEDASKVFADGVALADQAEKLTSVPVDFLPSARRLPPVKRAQSPPIDVLFVGRYHHNKGPDVLLKALSILNEQGHDLRTEMYGAGDLQSELTNRINKHNLSKSVELNPPIGLQVLADRLASTRLLVIPSRFESLPLILGDAVQARVPVVATRVGDMGDVVKSLGIGTVVESEDPEALAQTIVSSLDDPLATRDWAAADRLLSPGAAASTLLSALLSESSPDHAD